MKRLKLFLGLVAALFMAVTGSMYAQTPFSASDAPTPTSNENGGRWATNTKWYFLHFVNSDDYHTSGYMGTQGDAFINSNGQLLLNGTTKPTTTAGLWCFVGDEGNGYKFYNRYTQTSQVFSITTGGVAKMLAEGTADNTQRFDYAATTNEGDDFRGKATFKLHSTDNSYLNNSDGEPKCHIGVWDNAEALGAPGSVIDIIEATYDDLVKMGVKVKLSTDSEKNYFYLINKRSGKYAAFNGSTGVKQVTFDELSNAALWYFTEDGKLHNAATNKLVNGTSMDETGCTMYIEENILNPGYFCVSKRADYTSDSWDDQNQQTGIGGYAPKTGDAEGTSWSVTYSTGSVAKDKLNWALDLAKSAIGNNPGNYPQSAIDEAQAVLDNQSSTDGDFTEATTTLQNSMILPVSGKYYTITSAYTQFENRQGKTMSAYVDGTTLKWKATDFSDETLYWQIYEEGDKYVFKNYGTKNYISSYADNTYSMGETAAANTGFTWFEGGICNIKVADGNFHANNHSSGDGTGSTIIKYGSGATGASAWYIKEVENPDLLIKIARLENTIATYRPYTGTKCGIHPGQYSVIGGSIDNLQTKINAAQTLIESGSETPQEYIDAADAIKGSATFQKNEMEVGCYYRIQSTTRSTYTGLQVNDPKQGTYKMLNFALDENAPDPSQIWKLEQEGGNYFLVNVASGLYPQEVPSGGGNTTLVNQKNEAYKFTWDIFAEATAETMPIHRIYFGGTQVNIESNGNVNYWNAENARHFIYKVASTEEEMLTLVKKWAASPNLTAIANATKISITEDATQVISPNEFADPEVVNAAIDAVKTYADASTLTLEQAQALYNNYKIVETYVTNANANDGILSLPYTLKAQYGTIILPINYAKPTNVKLYSCGASDPNGVLTLVEYTAGETKNKPFIVEYTDEASMPTAESPKEYQLIGYQRGAGTTNVTKGWLTGVLQDGCTVPEGSYILSKKDDRMGFFQIGSGTTYNAAKYKCYLTVTAQAAAPKALYFDANGATTAISEIFGGQNGKVEIYDLAGHRLNSLQKGVNIVNGKKIIVR